MAALNGYDRVTLGISYYDVPVKLTDSGSPPKSATYIVRVIIESNNDNDHSPGTKNVRGKPHILLENVAFKERLGGV